MSTAFPYIWQVNANGWVSADLPSRPGNLTLGFQGNQNPSADDSFAFTGNLELAGGASALSGQWDGVAKKITFARDIGGLIQNYTGFLGDHDPGNLILGGGFAESDIPSSAPRAQFGWFATAVPPIG